MKELRVRCFPVTTEPRPPIVWTLRADGTADCMEHGPFQHYRGGPNGCPVCKAQHPHAEETD